MAKHVVQGKAFEYACLEALSAFRRAHQLPCSVIDSEPLDTARKCYETLEPTARADYDKGAAAGIELLVPLEPNLAVDDGCCLNLMINSDSAAEGSSGDVSDIVCFKRREDGSKWHIGISCKHNHAALRHPRITSDRDFGSTWTDRPCSDSFIAEMNDILADLPPTKGRAVTNWRDMPDKIEKYYRPVLDAYIAEIERMCAEDDAVPALLLTYFFGSKDFYKIITQEGCGTTTLMAFNMNGTLAATCKGMRPHPRLQRSQMPRRLLNVDRIGKDGVSSKTTAVFTFDGGWVVSLRLHNKDSKAFQTSLAWDVQLQGRPVAVFEQSLGWD